MSIWPAYLAFSSAITLPMSLTLDAPTAAITRSHRLLRLVIGQLLRHVALDDVHLLALLLRQFRPAALLIHAKAFLALLHHLGEEVDEAGIGGQNANHARRCGC